uniref:Uncharacterized protein n=1 Tax=Meloidogyne javanica TaxID=6303 RepID=A0A915MKH2_MELJA
RNEKHEIARQKCMRARNEYLLCIDAANSSLYKYFADDVSNIIDVCCLIDIRHLE